jgi:hypothetical protein
MSDVNDQNINQDIEAEIEEIKEHIDHGSDFRVTLWNLYSFCSWLTDISSGKSVLCEMERLWSHS